MANIHVEKVKEDSFPGKNQWLRSKINYGFGTYRGLLTITIVYEFILILTLGSFSEPMVNLLGAPLLPITLDDGTRVARIVMLYHSFALPFVAAITYFILEFCDVRKNWESRTKILIFPGSMIASICGILFAYFFPHNWIIHGLFIFGLSLVFLGGLFLFIGVFPWKKFPDPEKKLDGPYLFGINIAQVALALFVFCVLVSTIIGAAAGAYFGNGFEAFLAEHVLIERHLVHTLFEAAIISHLHIMLALIDVGILLVVFRYTFPEQQGRWYLASMVLTIPGILVMSIGAWLVTIADEINLPFDSHYLIYAGAAILLLAGIVLAFTGWKKTSKEILGNSYDSSSRFTRIKAAFKDPVKLGLYFQFIWVNIVMTLPGIFLALSLRDDSILTRITGIPSFRESGPEFVELMVARGHWHVLATLSAIIMLLLALDYLNVQGRVRQVIGWILNIGSILGFLFAVIFIYSPHFDPRITQSIYYGVANVEAIIDTYIANTPLMQLSFLIIDLGIVLFVFGLIMFCFHQLIEILKGKMDVTG
ncbi:MAG: hypothetical protein ACFFFG_05980 [Candidatus Thorarchaeota archaeon]